MIIAYLELPGQEEAHALFTEIAKGCIKITEEYLRNTQELLLSSCKQTYEDSKQEAIKINTIANFFRGISENALPFEGHRFQGVHVDAAAPGAGNTVRPAMRPPESNPSFASFRHGSQAPSDSSRPRVSWTTTAYPCCANRITASCIPSRCTP